MKCPGHAWERLYDERDYRKCKICRLLQRRIYGNWQLVPSLATKPRSAGTWRGELAGVNTGSANDLNL